MRAVSVYGHRLVTLPVAIEDRLRLRQLPGSHREAPVSGVTAEA